MSNKNGLLKSILPWVVLLFLIGGLVTYMNQGNSKEIKYSEFVEVVQDEKIKEVEIVPSSLVVDVSGKYTKKVDGKSTEYEFTTTIPNTEAEMQSLTGLLNEKGIETTIVDANDRGVFMKVIISILPYVLLLGGMFFIFKMMGQGGGNAKAFDFGNSRAKLEKNQTTRFADVAGADEEKEESNVLVGHLSMDSVFTREDFDTKQHFTQPPAHYTEASLVKALEELGIGRPSTYAPTISIILGRRYVTKEAKNLYLTEIGEVVNNIMKQSFPSIVDANFTANMEGLLDMVEEGKVAWKDVIRNFYPDLDEAVKRAEIELESVKIEDEVTDVICEECGRNMVIKYGPHGKFLACPGFPECRNTKPYLEKIGVPCPVCGKDVVIRKTKKGRKYYGCENNPECDFMSWQKPSKEKCPDCGGYMLEKGNKLVCADEKCGYVKTIGK